MPETGTPTFHTRVDAWQCDFNGHWNTTCYCRAVQSAAEVAAALGGRSGPGAAVVPARHMRFHRELRSGEAVEVRSFALATEDGTPATAHVVRGGGRIAATAFDTGSVLNPGLPALPDVLRAQVLPRGLSDPAADPWTDDPERDLVLELGAVRPGDVMPDGSLHYESLVRWLAVSSHHHGTRLGFTPDLADTEGIGRMLVEMRFARHGACAAGTFVRSRSRMVRAEGKSYTTRHLLLTHAGDRLAEFDIALLAVDLRTRKATALPSFVTDPDAPTGQEDTGTP
ncbi:hypothetical protein HKCCE2091_00300 [Rhodobacterales bacterium HKCCE2091]|nr:hypothetical protein [Rhodobacterales bacterium HKCCE2091]